MWQCPRIAIFAIIYQMLLPLLSAILGIIAFLPKNLWFFGLFFLSPFFIFLIKENKIYKLLLGTFIFRFALALGTVYYTIEPISWLVSLFIFLGLPLSVFLLKIVLKRLNIQNSAIILFSLPFLWTLFDYLQAQHSLLPTHIITAGNIFGLSPYLGLADFGGLIFLILFSAIVNLLFAALIINLDKLKIKKIATLSAAIIAIIIAGWQISQIQLQKNKETYAGLKNFLQIASISTNNNFSIADISQIKEKLPKKTDLLIFPEDIFKENVSAEQYLTIFKNMAQETNSNIVATFDTFQNGRKYNSSVLFNKKGEVAEIYNKNYLTFIGEYWPFPSWRPLFLNLVSKNDPKVKNYAIFNPNNSYFKGTPKLFSLDNINFSSAICLEIHYPNYLKQLRNSGANFFINPTSNRWVEPFALKHFLYLENNLRNIESVWLKLPIISSGVNDYAALFTPDGKINFAQIKEEKYSIFFGEVKF